MQFDDYFVVFRFCSMFRFTAHTLTVGGACTRSQNCELELNETQREGKSFVEHRASAAAATLYLPILCSETEVCSRNGFSLALEIMFSFLLSAIVWPFIIHCTRSTVVFPMDLLQTHSHIYKKQKTHHAPNAELYVCVWDQQMLIDFFSGCRFALIWKLDTVLRTLSDYLLLLL